jgi:sugar phosphate isomerase/epimerase
MSLRGLDAWRVRHDRSLRRTYREADVIVGVAPYVQEFLRPATSRPFRFISETGPRGDLGDADDKARTQAIENHFPWVEAAKRLGCHSIRVNAASKGSFEEQQKLAADGLARLSEFAGQLGMNVIVENHGGLSSNGEWLAGVMKLVNRPNCGTLPDFGNFHDYDRYRGVEELMPFAKGVSAKSHEFDDAGNEVRTDYDRMLRLVLAAGYRGWVGIEYEGTALPEADGIRATKKLLERVRDSLTA